MTEEEDDFTDRLLVALIFVVVTTLGLLLAVGGTVMGNPALGYSGGGLIGIIIAEGVYRLIVRRESRDA